MTTPVTRIANKLYLRMRHREAWSSATAPPVAAERGFESLRGHKYCLLTSFRRSAEPVPTPVWFGLAGDGRLYLRSEAGVGKVKRIRANPDVRVAPCDVRGKPLGPPAEGRARVLTSDDGQAERAIAANYGLGRTLYEKAGERLSVPTVYIEVQPAP